MRPKHMLLVIALAMLPLALALLLVGTGGLSAPGPSSSTVAAGSARVSLRLTGGGGGARVSQCGSTHAFRDYPGQGTIDFRGSITPAGPWSLTLKLKACYGGQFQSAGDAQARVSPNGTYNGNFPIPIAGYYYARAELKRSGQLAARSQKVYFAVH